MPSIITLRGTPVAPSPVATWVAQRGGPAAISSGQVARWMFAAPREQWDDREIDLEQAGVPSEIVLRGRELVESTATMVSSPWFKMHLVLRGAAAVASAYHGGRRHHGSILWTTWWFLMGSMFPLITPAVAFVQGFGRPRSPATFWDSRTRLADGVTTRQRSQVEQRRLRRRPPRERLGPA